MMICLFVQLLTILGLALWYDWVLVRFLDTNEHELHYPHKILGFMEKDDQSGPICFGQMCAMQMDRKKQDSSTGLFKHWHVEQKPNSADPLFWFVKIDSIINACLSFLFTFAALKNNDQCQEMSKHVIIVKDRHKEWPELFLHDILKLKKQTKSTSSWKKR